MQGHRWCRAEQTDVDPVHSEPRAIRCDGKIARGDQLAARRRRQSVDLGDHRLRQRRDALHQAESKPQRSARRTAALRRDRYDDLTCSFRSCPAENSAPSVSMTITRTDRRIPPLTQAAASLSISASDKVLAGGLHASSAMSTPPPAASQRGRHRAGHPVRHRIQRLRLGLGLRSPATRPALSGCESACAIKWSVARSPSSATHRLQQVQFGQRVVVAGYEQHRHLYLRQMLGPLDAGLAGRVQRKANESEPTHAGKRLLGLGLRSHPSAKRPSASKQRQVGREPPRLGRRRAHRGMRHLGRIDPLRTALHVRKLIAQRRNPALRQPCAFDSIALCVIPAPAPCANTKIAHASTGRISSAETLSSPTGMCSCLHQALAASASQRAVSARAASTSGGKSTSPHSSPWMSSVHTSLDCARWWMTRRYQMVVPSAVRSAARSRRGTAPHRPTERRAGRSIPR